MADDPYQVLGIARGASDEDIRRAYRRLAKELHPDLNPGNDRAAEDRFKALAAAYKILGDPDKRRAYDAGEISASGEPIRTYAGAGAGSPFGRDSAFSDAFSDFFSRGGGRTRAGFGIRGQDLRYTLEVDFMEAIDGAKKRVTMPEGGILDISVPAGVSEGQILRLKGKGAAGFRGGEAGDALVEIHIRPHARFERDGDNILAEVPITIDEAVLGGKITIPTVAGNVQLAVPKGTSSGKMLRLKGQGARNARTGVRGDHLVSIRIVMPAEIDEPLAYFMAEWRRKNAYDPGRGS